MSSEAAASAFLWKAIGMRPSDYVAEMNAAFDAKLYISALNLALILPDVCATSLSEKSWTNRTKYKDWVDTYLMPVIAPLSCFSISAADIYQIRNVVLHNGSLATSPGEETSYHNIRFHIFSPEDQLLVSQGSIGVGENAKDEDREFHLTINLARYIKCMTEAVGNFLQQHPECDKQIDKGRLAYSGITDFAQSE